jgi:hypothetical protein
VEIGLSRDYQRSKADLESVCSWNREGTDQLREAGEVKKLLNFYEVSIK